MLEKQKCGMVLCQRNHQLIRIFCQMKAIAGKRKKEIPYLGLSFRVENKNFMKQKDRMKTVKNNKILCKEIVN